MQMITIKNMNRNMNQNEDIAAPAACKDDMIEGPNVMNTKR